MHRGFLAIVSVVVAGVGCGDFRDQFSSHANVAAQAGGAQLSSERVAGILGRAGGGPTVQAAEFVSNLWLDYTLFGQAVATNQIKSDSATISRVMWPDISEARLRIWHDTLVSKMTKVPPQAAESLYTAGQVRLFQHIIAVPTGPAVADTAKAKAMIQDALGQVRRGADFGKLAAQISVDGSKSDEGYLGVGPRGQFVPVFEDAAWALTPGQVSGVVQSQFGFHLIRRPTLEEARPRFHRYLQSQVGGRNDSALIADLTSTHDLKVATGAATAMRAAAADIEASRTSSRALVSMKGGDLSVGDLMRWVGAFPMEVRLQIRSAPDSLLGGFARRMAINTLLLRQADENNVRLPAPAWQFVTLRYQTAIQQAKTELGLAVPELSDSSKLDPDQKLKLVAEKVEDYFNRLIQGRTQPRPLLPQLTFDLRAQRKGRLNQAGLARAVGLATAQFKRDSAARGAGAAPQPGIIQPAPGGPPVPAQSGDSSKK